MKVLSAEQMRELDRETIEEIGIPGAVLMENAGRGAAESIVARFADLFPGPVLVLAGKGNNGGDGYVIARCLQQRGWRVQTVVLCEHAAVAGDARRNLDILLKLGGEVVFAPDEGRLAAALAKREASRLLVDALFGTGLGSAVRGHYAFAVNWLNRHPAPVAAVDIPSGLDAGNGQVLGCCVEADLTLTFAQPKIGQVVFPGAGYVGELKTVDIGIPAGLLEKVAPAQIWVDAAEARRMLPSRPTDGHKGTFGHLLVIGGSTGKSGAAALSADGAVRAGAGLVTVGCPVGIHPVLEVKLTEPMTVPLTEVDGGLSLQAMAAIAALWEGKQALALGPGLGRGEETLALVRCLVRSCSRPMVIDADGLNALAEHCEILAERAPGSTVLTPHPGEMSRLAGVAIDEIQRDRVGFSRAFAHRHQVVLVLKGARTLTAAPDGRVFINSTGNPGMAAGGMGDVLTGLIGGLLGQGMAPAEAAALGVYLHGRAADRVASRQGCAGLTASEVLREIPAARLELAGERSQAISTLQII